MQFITPTCIVRTTKSRNSSIKPNPKKRAKTIEVSGYQKPKTDLTRKIWLMFLMREIKRLHFLTITFPIGTTDFCAHSMLNSVLTNLRKQGYMKTYIWVSERQENGTIHFHFFITQYTPASVIQSAISSALTTAYKNGISTYPPSKCANYQGFFFSKNKKGKVQNLKTCKGDTRRRVTSYVTKYVTKDEEATELMPICHRRTGCSKDVSYLQRKQSTFGIFNDGIDTHIKNHSEIFGKKFTEIGRTIWVFTRIPPREAEGFWHYIEYNDDIYYNYHAYKEGKPTR